jgi:peptidoglycan/LPS O-acetylase OafA/YrhL
MFQEGGAPAQSARDRLLANLSRKNIPGLDGIRGIAALSVVLFHGWSEHFPGRIAVQVFFVISGLLITWLLVGEEKRFGRIDRKAFYLRRALRLFPALYLLLAWEWATRFPNVAKRGLAAAAFYYSNYRLAHARDMYNIVQTWSLSVEEHFYLIWPQVFIWVRNRRSLMYLCLGISLLELAWRMGAEPWLGSLYISFATETNTAAILIGCGIALLLWLEPSRFPSFCLHPAIGAISLVALIALAQVPEHAQLRWAIPPAILFSAIVVVQAITYEWRVLENPVARFLGRSSYAIYLWGLVARQVAKQFANGIRPVVMILSVIAIATISQYLVEKPAQWFGRWWLARARNRTP